MKKILKKEINIKSEKIAILILLSKTNDKLFTGIKPPDEIMVKDKLNELKALKSDKYKTIKIVIVNIK